MSQSRHVKSRRETVSGGKAKSRNERMKSEQVG